MATATRLLHEKGSACPLGGRRSGIICVLLILLFAAGCSTAPPVGDDIRSRAPIPETLALELDQWDEAITTLSIQRGQYPGSADIAYSLGLAYWGKLGSVRGEEYSFKPVGLLGREEESLLLEALDLFKAAFLLQPNDEIGAKSMYFAGLCLDIGNLQRFPEAMEAYALCSNMYPATQAGWRCLERYDKLKEKYEGISGGSHGMGQ